MGKVVAQVSYRLCPKCFRAVPSESGEIFCIQCGEALLLGCPGCKAPIFSPYARYCGACGHGYSKPESLN